MRVELDADDLGPWCEGTDHARRAPAAETDHQHPPPARRGEREQRRRERIPDRARRRLTRPVERREGPVDQELAAARSVSNHDVRPDAMPARERASPHTSPMVTPERGFDERVAVALALPVPVYRSFDYAVPPALVARVGIGRRAIVPLGARRVVGVIVGPASGEVDEGSLRAIERVIDERPAIAPGLLAVLREEARAVLCPLGIALASALPSGSAPRPRRALGVTARGAQALASGALPAASREVVEAIASRRTLRHAAATKRLVRALVRDGLVEEIATENAPRAKLRSVRIVSLAAEVDTTRAGEALTRAPKQAAVLREIAASGPLPVADLEARIPGAPAALRALLERGLVRVEDRAAPRDVLGRPIETPGRVRLSPEQDEASAELRRAVRERRSETYLLHGVTGSGKTEVYLQAIEEALEGGRQALVLVPEITLTHQMVARLRARFGDALAVLHSGLGPGERLEQWESLRRGETPIAVGARSALFAPLESPGVIVIDEEHDSAYKNEEGFRYHARDLAARRAHQAGCPLVLGSATPSLETRFAADRNAIRRLVLPHRIGGRPLPSVEIVDLEKERAFVPKGRRVVLSRTLRRAIGETLEAGGQTILLLNRRGFSTRIFCFECGHAERCRHCDISLVFHAEANRLRCHYCGFEIEPPENCSGCQASGTALLGIGTERLEEEVRTRFPEARIARLDRDAAARRGGAERILRGLREGAIDILIGTQMVAKGHDFPGVLLVGVVAADLGLHLPDFRAAERTFQLLTQVAGRAGRGNVPGRVVVQTFVPSHYAIRPVRDHDYEAFYAEELGQRAALGYPPFGRLVHALVSSPDAAAGAAAIERLAKVAESAGALRGAASAPGAIELLGPAPAPLARLRDRFRFQLLAKGPDAEGVIAIARALVEEVSRLPASISASVDVNPTHML